MTFDEKISNGKVQCGLNKEAAKISSIFINMNTLQVKKYYLHYKEEHINLSIIYFEEHLKNKRK